MRLPSATALPLQPADASRERLQTAARELESQFAQMMLKSMRSTSFGDSMLGDNTMYRDMYDQQLAKEMSKGRGLGLAPMIERQLSRSLPMTPAASEAMPMTIGPLSSGRPATHAPMALMKNLPLPMPLPGATIMTGLSLAPSHGGVSLPALAPLSPPPAPEPAAISNGVGAPGHVDGPCDPNAQLDCSSPEAFVQSIWPHAVETARELGVSAKALVAQAALETGWGRRLVGGDGSHNLFGIKASGHWDGKRVDSGTHEFVNGRRVETRAQFRAYGSVHESFADYRRLMHNDRYAGALAAGEDTSRFANALQKAGYATDPAYAAKISAIANGPTLRRALEALDDTHGRAFAALPDTTTRG
ncbi:flagellar assembly peptidoglycan hydrolase FlgJ [Lysobacter sp. A286]